MWKYKKISQQLLWYNSKIHWKCVKLSFPTVILWNKSQVNLESTFLMFKSFFKWIIIQIWLNKYDSLWFKKWFKHQTFADKTSLQIFNVYSLNGYSFLTMEIEKEILCQ